MWRSLVARCGRVRSRNQIGGRSEPPAPASGRGTEPGWTASGTSHRRRRGWRSSNRIGGADAITDRGRAGHRARGGAKKSGCARARRRRVAACERGSRRAGSGGEESRDFRAGGWYGPVWRGGGHATAPFGFPDRGRSNRGGGDGGGVGGRRGS